METALLKPVASSSAMPHKNASSFKGRGSTCVFFMNILRWIYNKKTEVALYYQ